MPVTNCGTGTTGQRQSCRLPPCGLRGKRIADAARVTENLTNTTASEARWRDNQEARQALYNKSTRAMWRMATAAPIMAAVLLTSYIPR